MKKTLTILIFILLILCGCAKEPAFCYSFDYKGVEITPGSAAGNILYALGQPEALVQSPSCAFEGVDTTYYHGSIYIDTYQLQGGEYIWKAWFADDTVSTREGVRIGANRQEVETAYGPFQGDVLELEAGGVRMTIGLAEEKVQSILYEQIFE